jgi:hypothetical protein
MKNFNELNIQVEKSSYDGKGIDVEEFLNQDFSIHRFKIVDSKFPKKPGDLCLHMQIKLDNEDRVVFTLGKTLIATMKQVKEDHLPFKAKIIKIGKRYEFTAAKN